MFQIITFSRTMLLYLCFIPICLFGEKDPIKYGKIDKADLEMKTYPTDTSAVAAILCDFGHFSSNNLQFVRTIRIKIFKKEGTSWANQVFSFSSDANIRGTTYNLENGEIVESKLKSESIFKENVTGHNYRRRVAMPNVKEGSIIDMEFSYRGLPSEWRFQEVIPVRRSELIIEPSPYLKFRKNYFGFELLSESTDIRWVGKDMPAFKKEPYMNSAENYISRFEIEILNISIPGNGNNTGYYQELSSTWEAVNRTLSESTHFGKAMKGCLFLNDIAKDIEKKYSTPLERLKAAHEVVKKTVKWNERESVASSTEGLSVPFNKKLGNSGDVNLILIQLLKKLDFDVYPVALSTRSNGFLSPVSPSLDKLNYVVAYVLLDDKKYFLDATEEFIPVGMLPKRCINLQGRIIDENKSSWVDLSTAQLDRKFVYFDLKLEPENILTGKISLTNSDYAALDFRNKYGKFNSKEEYLKSLESEHKGLSITDCNITNLDSIYLPLKESYNVKIKNITSTAGNLVYINPMLYEQLTSNPFKSEDRKYPVDFVYPSDLTYVLKLELPECAKVEEFPKEFKVKLHDGSVYAQYQIVNLDKVIQLSYRFVVKKPIFSEGEYAELRAFYSELVKKHSEQIVIKTL